MDIVINNYLTVISLIAIVIMIAGLIFAIIKKTLITYGIIFANFLVFILTLVFENDILGATYVNLDESRIIIETAGLGFRPMYLTPEYAHQFYTIFTSMFVHAGFLHILGNMLIFFFMGIAFEQRIGWKKFIIIYILTGIFAALTQSIINMMAPANLPADEAGLQLLMNGGAIPLVGASGAIFGIIGAFAFSYPRDEVVMPIPMPLVIIMKIKVIYAAIIFAVMETVIVLWNNQTDFTAHYAHLGGLVSGFILAAIIIRGKTHTIKGKTIYFDPYQERPPLNVDFTHLEQLADTPELKEILERVKLETVAQVQNIWLGHFFEKIKCPQCKNSLKHSDGKLWCTNCDYKTSYLKQK